MQDFVVVVVVVVVSVVVVFLLLFFSLNNDYFCLYNWQGWGTLLKWNMYDCMYVHVY